MADVYASAVGTTVLQLKEIPTRPEDFAGKLCLFDLVDGADIHSVRTFMQRFGEIKSISYSNGVAFVQFTTHDSALSAKKAGPWPEELCMGLDTQYNERSYDGRHGESEQHDDDGRGWCVFESAVSTELLARLNAYPRMKAALDSLPPKLLSLASGTSPKDAGLMEQESVELRDRVKVVTTRIKKATFTGKGDMDKVPCLYTDYVKRIAGVLQATLSLGSEDTCALELPPMPHISTPNDASLQLADGQLLLRLARTSFGNIRRRAGGEGALRLVAAQGQFAQLLLGGHAAKLSLESNSQVVLPWRPPDEGWAAAFQISSKLDNLRKEAQDLSKRVQRLKVGEVKGIEGLHLTDAQGLAECEVPKDLQLTAAAASLPLRNVERTLGMKALRNALDSIQSTLNERAVEEAEKGIAAATSSQQKEATAKHQGLLETQRALLEKLTRTSKEIEEEALAAVQEGAQHEEEVELMSKERDVKGLEGQLQVLRRCANETATRSHSIEAVPAGEMAGAFRRDIEALRSLRERAGQLKVQALSLNLAEASLTPQVVDELRAGCGVFVLEAQAVRLRTVMELFELTDDVVKAGQCLQEPLTKLSHEIVAVDDEGSTGAQLLHKKLKIKEGLQDLHQKAAELQQKLLPDVIEPVVARALRATGAAGERRYASGQWLMVRQPNGQWIDAQVSTDGAPPWFEGQELPLHPWNHAPCELSQVDFEKLRGWWMQMLLVQHSHIADALTGKRLDVMEQCVSINLYGAGGNSNQDASTLSNWLHERHAERCQGSATAKPAAALLTGPPAAGKTSLLSQIVVHSLKTELVPVLIKVQSLQRRLLDSPEVFATAWNWVDAFLRLEYQDPTVYRFLRQAMLARRLLLLLDGLDEGGINRNKIERHVSEVLAPQGHVMLCTSRPAGLQGERFAGFRRLELSPLTDEQQKEALTQRLGPEWVDPLLKYLREQVPFDTDTRLRVTANPLMLSMVASIFELRDGVGMPETIAELYKEASEAMLKRGGASSQEVRRLLQAVFFEAHITEQREITDVHLNSAARSAKVTNEVLVEVRSRAMQDKLPLLSLLTTEPVRLQSSHLSFQEYFTARLISEEDAHVLERTPSWWTWNAWWRNTAKLGSEMGTEFASGLLRATSIEGGVLDLSGKLGGDRTTVLTVLKSVLMVGTLIECNVRGNNLDLQAAKTLSTVGTEKRVMLFGVKPNDTLADFSGSQLSPSDGVLIASDLTVSLALIELDLQSNQLGPEGGKAIAEALKVNRFLTKLSLYNNSIGREGGIAVANALHVNMALVVLELDRNNLGEEGGKAVAAALKVNTVLRELYLSYNGLGLAGHAAIAEALKVNKMLTKLELWSSNIGKEGAVAIAAGLQINSTLTDLRLGHSNLGSEGCRSIAEALKANKALQKLYLQGNDIGSDGAIAIAEALKENRVLQELYLFRNCIGEAGALAISEGLSVNTVLTALNLRRNAFGSEKQFAPFSVSGGLQNRERKSDGEATLRESVREREGFILLL